MNILETVNQPATEPVEVEETKAETFKRLAVKRVGNAIDKLRLIGNLSNKGNYEYTEEQVDRIESALKVTLEDVIRQLRHTKKEKQSFTL